MKKRAIIVFSVLGFVLLFAAYLYMDHLNLSWEVVFEEECSEEKTWYFDYKKRKVYTKCIEKILVAENKNEKMELKDYILKENNSMDSIFEKALREDSYWDGGTSVYYYQDFAIVSCNRMNDQSTNTDIIIMDKQVDIDKVCSGK